MNVRRLALVVPGLLLAGLVVLLQVRPDPPELATEATPLLTAAVAHDESFLRNGRLVGEVSQPTVLVASGVDGRITSVAVAPGDALVSGDTVATVAGVVIVAAHTDAPFYRTLAVGASGDDVAQLQCFLAQHGMYEGPCDGSFGPATASAVTLVNESIGRGRVADFDPRYVIWLPMESFDVGRVGIDVGAWFPVAGTTIIESEVSVTAARVETDPLSPTDVERYGPFTFTATDPEYDVPVDSDLSVDAADLGPLADALLAVAEQTGTADSPITDVEGIPQGISGTVRGAKVVQSIAVPTVAIVEADDALCVYVEAGDGFRPVVVTAVGSSVSGATFIDGELGAGDQVLANPGTLAMTTC
ncbi:MAG: peptidoglycan-binding domain-containing protein [Acidimicrobiia bacterium]